MRTLAITFVEDTAFQIKIKSGISHMKTLAQLVLCGVCTVILSALIGYAISALIEAFLAS